MRLLIRWPAPTNLQASLSRRLSRANDVVGGISSAVDSCHLESAPVGPSPRAAFSKLLLRVDMMIPQLWVSPSTDATWSHTRESQCFPLPVYLSQLCAGSACLERSYRRFAVLPRLLNVLGISPWRNRWNEYVHQSDASLTGHEVRVARWPRE